MSQVNVTVSVDVSGMMKEIADNAIAVFIQTKSEKITEHYLNACNDIVEKVKEIIS